MSPRRTILRELPRKGDGENGSGYTRPASIPGFSEQPDKYQKAVNELLAARLVQGHKDEEGHMAIAINDHRMADVRKELRPIWARPAVLATIVLIGVAVAVGFVI
jgi:hypothetical protein